MDEMNNTPDMTPQQPNTDPQPNANQQPYVQPQAPQQSYQAPQPSYQANQQPPYQAPQPPVYQAPTPPPYLGMPNRDGKKGPAIAGMVLGIVSLVFFCIPWLSIICAIIGLILGVVGMKSPAGKGMAIAGVVCSVVALAVAVIILIIAGTAAGSLYSFLSDLEYYYY